ncbi:hypothetical protein [Robinsoniella peoriensis]|uniref:hypothetical protein n=1 Tax=Robinsoniella peoriensis TaxID=180332 RepID=UPI00126A5D0B|nr:hypothetical protein [Robinsoniella peoriensis]
MNNKNALIALAYIKESPNPLTVFCNYIIICLNKGKNYKLRHDEIAKDIEKEFGLKMPHHMIKMCCRILCNEKRIVRLQNGAGYELKDFSFDMNEFDMKRDAFMNKEKLLINGLMSYAEDYNRKWTYDETREYLTNFLVMQGNAANIFEKRNMKSIESEKFVPPEWYIGKYVSELLENNNDERTKYLSDIINGLMIYIGVYETQDYTQDREQKFKGTTFFVDTKLLLRLMGYSWKLEVESAQEFANLIEKEYGGNICVFEHTIGEVESALYNAAESLKRREEIYDYELRIYSTLNECNEFDFKIFAQTVRQTITDKLHFKIQDITDWSQDSSRTNHLDNTKLKEFIKSRHPMWKDRAIDNDVKTINYINILRKGDYSAKYGGKRKLPVFITSNTPLVWDVREYIQIHGDEDKGVAGWKVNALPIISDNMLMCRLWVPKAQNLSSLPTMTLARNAYAAQQTNSVFFDKMKRTAKELQKKHPNIDVIDISDIRREKLEEILVKKVAGDLEEITTEVLAITIDELVTFEAEKLNKDMENWKEQNSSKTVIIQRQKEQIIRSAVQRYKDKIGTGKLLIQGAELFWLWGVLIFGILALALPKLKGVSMLKDLPYFGLGYIVLYLLIKIVEKIFYKQSVNQKIIEKVVMYVWGKYSKRVKFTLVGLEVDYTNEILQACIEETPLFFYYQKYCNI